MTNIQAHCHLCEEGKAMELDKAGWKSFEVAAAKVKDRLIKTQLWIYIVMKTGHIHEHTTLYTDETSTFGNTLAII